MANLDFRNVSHMEKEIVSVERVKEYHNVPNEAPQDRDTDNYIPKGWPSKGSIEFNNYSTRYRAGLKLVLKGVTLTIDPEAKVGIVGEF